MKYRIAYYLVLLYVTVMIKPVLPIVSDAYSHLFSEAIHISTIHAKYGSNHLAYDLAHATDDENNKHQATPKADDPFPYHISVAQSDAFTFSKQDVLSYCIFNPASLIPVSIYKHTPPPRLA